MTLTKAQIARVKSLEDARGQVTPDRIVADAKKKSSPLHALFQWNITKAAEVYWIARARAVIGAVQILVTNETTTLKVSGYMRDTAADGQGYRSVMALRADPVQARESLIFTLEVAAGHVRRALDLAAPLGLAGEVDGLLDQIVGVQRVIRTAA